MSNSPTINAASFPNVKRTAALTNTITKNVKKITKPASNGETAIGSLISNEQPRLKSPSKQIKRLCCLGISLASSHLLHNCINKKSPQPVNMSFFSNAL